MRPLTLLRATAWAAVVITGWSLNIRWGSETAVGNGPPVQWERHIVGALLLSGICALAVSLAGARAKRVSRAAAVATLAAAGSLAIAVYLRFDASSSGFPDLVEGPGWTWMAAGCGMAFGSAVGALAASAARPGQAGSQQGVRRKK